MLLYRKNAAGNEALREALADAQDLIDLREVKEAEGDEPALPLEEVKKQLGLS